MVFACVCAFTNHIKSLVLPVTGTIGLMFTIHHHCSFSVHSRCVWDRSHPRRALSTPAACRPMSSTSQPRSPLCPLSHSCAALSVPRHRTLLCHWLASLTNHRVGSIRCFSTHIRPLTMLPRSPLPNVPHLRLLVPPRASLPDVMPLSLLPLLHSATSTSQLQVPSLPPQKPISVSAPLDHGAQDLASTQRNPVGSWRSGGGEKEIMIHVSRALITRSDPASPTTADTMPPPAVLVLTIKIG
jgi:hypothetical protein